MVYTIQQRTIHLWCRVVVVVAEYLLLFHTSLVVRREGRAATGWGTISRAPSPLSKRQRQNGTCTSQSPAVGCIQSSTLGSIRGTIVVVVVVGWWIALSLGASKAIPRNHSPDIPPPARPWSSKPLIWVIESIRGIDR